jgi:hypothetical protein
MFSFIYSQCNEAAPLPCTVQAIIIEYYYRYQFVMLPDVLKLKPNKVLLQYNQQSYFHIKVTSI